MKKKFYCLLFKDEKKYGIPMSPQGFDTLFGKEVKPVIIPDGCTFTIFDGEFAPFHNSNTRAHFVNEELKNLIKDFLPQNYPLEFLPIIIHNNQWGDKQYYLLHFTEIFDVIDLGHSKILPSTGDIAVPAICYEKAKDLDFFNSIAYKDCFIVSDKLRKEMKKRGLDRGMQFWEWKSY
jgi:hypothetical protein